MNNSPCATCKHCRKSKEYYVCDCWYCTNEESKYYRSLLNVDLAGETLKKVTWEGCKYWELDEDHKRVKRKADADIYKDYVWEIVKGEKNDRGAEKS